MSKFIQENDIFKRTVMYNRITQQYPDRIPVIFNIGKNLQQYIDEKKLTDKIKYKALISNECRLDSTISKFRENIKSTFAIYIFINNKVFSPSTLVAEIYDKEKGEDGFLYIDIESENTFG